MASDTPDFDQRKHCHSPSDDEESEKSSKRHKHYHHNHRHHRHRSKKHKDEAKDFGEDPLPQPLLPSILRLDDDVEEGEILDEEPTAEIKAVESREGLDVSNPVCSVYLVFFFLNSSRHYLVMINIVVFPFAVWLLRNWGKQFGFIL